MIYCWGVLKKYAIKVTFLSVDDTQRMSFFISGCISLEFEEFYQRQELSIQSDLEEMKIQIDAFQQMISRLEGGSCTYPGINYLV